MRTSYSALQTYLQCPQRYKFQEIDRIRAPKSREAMFGTLIHGTLRFMFERNPLFPTLDEVIGHYRAHWPALEIFNTESLHDGQKRAWTATDEKQYFEEGVRMLKSFYEKNAPWNYVVVDLESRFEVALMDEKTGRTHVLAGIMDRIDKLSERGYEILDYKTGKKMPSREAFEKDLQLSVYTLGLQKRWPHLNPEEITLSLYFVKHGEKLSMPASEAIVEDAKQHVLKTITQIERHGAEGKEFEPMPSRLCDWCGYRPLCPAWRHLYRKPKDADAQAADARIATLIKDYFSLKKEEKTHKVRLAEIQRELKEYMASAEVTRVFGEEGVIAQKIVQRFGYDWGLVQKILEPLGRWQEVLEADEAKLKRILAELPSDARSAIEEARVSAKTYVTLTGSSAKQHGTHEESRKEI